ncbi:MAG: alpha-keto acid decarboxylase family protein [Pseudomonadota bacterium]
MRITIGDYLLQRLAELQIKHVFGVPGDYNLGFLDQIVNFNDLNWVGNCNELNAAYAADGYARINGMSALVTTFGVGELSAINGIAGAYAEYVPIVNIVGMPSTITQAQKSLVHHTLGTGDFNVFLQMFTKVTIAQAIINPQNAARQIDRVLQIGFIKKRPVYIGLPSDITYKEIEVELKPLQLAYPKSNLQAVNEAVNRTIGILTNVKKPVFLADICAVRHPMKPHILKLIEKTGIPFATMNMGKGIIDESHPLFLGNYNGDFSSEGVQQRVESSDCIISFGTILSDFNTGGFTTKLSANVTIEIHSNYVQLKHSIYPDLYFADFIPALTAGLKGIKFAEVVTEKTIPVYTATQEAIKQERFWLRMSEFLQSEDIVLAETGTSLFGSLGIKIPDKVTYICQALWGSIGYSVGSLLGATLAAPDKRVILFVGDGSFQLTAQEVSTMLRYKTKPIIFLINNDGYTIERVIHGPRMTYNDIQMWQYAKLPTMFNGAVWSTQVKTELELETAINELDKHRQELCFVEIFMDIDDVPEILRKIGIAMAEQNKYF